MIYFMVRVPGMDDVGRFDREGGTCLPAMSLLDPHGRRINYLRLSVADRCNLRCSYWRPPEGDEGPAIGEILSDP